MKNQLITILAFFLATIIGAQNIAIDKKRVLKDTDHGYFGVELSTTMIFSTIEAVEPANQSKCDNKFDAAFGEEITLLPNIFTGYKWGANYFELSYASYHNYGAINVSGNPSHAVSQDYYGALQFQYFYQLPFKSSLIKMMIGPNIGWAFRAKRAWENSYTYSSGGFEYYSPSFKSRSPDTGDNLKNMVTGFNLRCDFKVAKNLTIVTKLNTTYLYISKDYFVDVPSPYSPPGTPVDVYLPKTNWNLSLYFGLKFDFYSKKKKQQTFDKLGIEDPYQK